MKTTRRGHASDRTIAHQKHTQAEPTGTHTAPETLVEAAETAQEAQDTHALTKAHEQYAISTQPRTVDHRRGGGDQVLSYTRLTGRSLRRIAEAALGGIVVGGITVAILRLGGLL